MLARLVCLVAVSMSLVMAGRCPAADEPFTKEFRAWPLRELERLEGTEGRDGYRPIYIRVYPEGTVDIVFYKADWESHRTFVQLTEADFKKAEMDLTSTGYRRVSGHPYNIGPQRFFAAIYYKPKK